MVERKTEITIKENQQRNSYDKHSTHCKNKNKQNKQKDNKQHKKGTPNQDCTQPGKYKYTETQKEGEGKQ